MKFSKKGYLFWPLPFVVAKCQNIKPLSWKCMSQCIFSFFESRLEKLISVRINQGQADRVTQIKMLNLKWAYPEKDQ